MDIKQTFLNLTSRTYPHGTEEQLFHLLPQDFDIDQHGNLFKWIGNNPTTMFASHLDTATSALSPVKHVIDGNIIKTDGTSILGADDKAGVTIMLWMIENKVPGLYYFFIGEEVGCVGSKKLSTELKESKIEGINKVISFDRRHTTSIITHQFGTRCCSDEFGTALAAALNAAESTFDYRNDPTGLYTDSAQFVKIYSECTNISVGYWAEHTFGESQNIEHLEKLARACTKIDWESLPIKRDPSFVEAPKYDYSYGYSTPKRYDGNDWWGDDYGYSNWTSSFPKENKTRKNEIYFFDDRKYSYWGSVTLDKYNGDIIKIDLCKERLEDEVRSIRNLLLQLEVEFSKINWDGLKLTVEKNNTNEFVDRKELEEFLPELDFWKSLIDEDDNDDYSYK